MAEIWISLPGIGMNLLDTSVDTSLPKVETSNTCMEGGEHSHLT